jgi:hypothetical protein
MRVRLALIPIAAAGILLAGCTNAPGATPSAAPTTPASNGVADLSADQILAKAQESLAGLDSFQAKGTMTQDGTAAAIDLVVNGDNSKAVIDLGGEAIEAIKIGTDAYVKLPDSLLAMFTGGNEAALALVKGKYLKISSNDPNFAELSSFANLRDELLKQDTGTANATKGEAKTINGTPAIGVNVEDGTLYVATQGEPYPLRLESAEGGIDFTSFNSAPQIVAPPADQVLDASQLAGVAGLN